MYVATSEAVGDDVIHLGTSRRESYLVVKQNAAIWAVAQPSTLGAVDSLTAYPLPCRGAGA